MRITIILTATIVIICLSLLYSLAQADIVFTSLRSGLSEIYVMNDDGSEVRQLTNNKFKEGRPIWSPNGRYIVFMRDVNSSTPGQPQLIHNFIMYSDGRHQENVTKPAGILGGNATWHPNGQYITMSTSGAHSLDIVNLDIVNNTVEYLTRNKEGKGGSTSPSWSPDGKQIVYEQTIIQNGRTIYRMNHNGNHAKELVPAKKKMVRNFPAYSPDGKYILYSETEFNIGKGFISVVASQINVMHADGSNQKELSIPKTWATGAACWAYNGTQIVFAAVEDGFVNQNGEFDIFRYNMKSRSITNLTNHLAADYSPHWIDGSLSVSSGNKLATQWGKMKIEKGNYNINNYLFQILNNK